MLKKITVKSVFFILISTYSSMQLLNYISRRYKARLLSGKASRVLQNKLSTPIPCISIPQSRKNYILSLKAFEVSSEVNLGHISSEEVLYTYIERAGEFGRKYNLSAEEQFTDAISRLPNISKGVLSGIPISVKDSIYQFNCHSSAGLIWNIEKVDPGDSILISMLRDVGGLPFVRGNTMQAFMWFESTNHIYGTSLNPWDLQRTTGGSSGGDAGLIAAQGALLAICGDLAGSIRIPAAFCGVYGFKPSSFRTGAGEVAKPHNSAMNPLELLVKVSYGPIGRCVQDLVLVVKTWWTKKLWKRDNLVPPLKFDDGKYEDQGKLKIGYFEDNSVFECADVVKNTLRMVREKLKADGHFVVEIEKEWMVKGIELFVKAASAIEGKYFLEALQGEDPCWPYENSYLKAQYPILAPILNYKNKKSGYKQSTYFTSLEKALTYKEFCILMGEILEFRKEFNKKWQDLGLDAAICPIWPLVAPQHRTTPLVSPAFSYAYIWNLLDFPAGVVPIKKVLQGENFYSSKIKDNYVQASQNIMENSIGMPVAIQVVGSTFNDEKVLKLMKIVQNQFQFFEVPFCKYTK